MLWYGTEMDFVEPTDMYWVVCQQGIVILDCTDDAVILVYAYHRNGTNTFAKVKPTQSYLESGDYTFLSKVVSAVGVGAGECVESYSFVALTLDP